jgi:hypothetical protein
MKIRKVKFINRVVSNDLVYAQKMNENENKSELYKRGVVCDYYIKRIKCNVKCHKEIKGGHFFFKLYILKKRV